MWHAMTNVIDNGSFDATVWLSRLPVGGLLMARQGYPLRPWWAKGHDVLMTSVISYNDITSL